MIEQLHMALEQKVNQLDTIIKKASYITSTLTDYTAFITTPDLKTNSIKKCELVSISGGCSLFIIVTQSGIVRNKMLNLSLDDKMATTLGEIINKNLSGLCTTDITFERIQSMQSELSKRVKLEPRVLINILNFIYEAIGELDDTEIYIDNTKSILKYNDIEKAQKMFTFLEDKKNLRQLIEGNYDKKVNIKIGSENEAEELKDCSLVTVNYSLNDKTVGKLGVIGPKRMDYAKVVASLDCISNHIDKILYQLYKGESEG